DAGRVRPRQRAAAAALHRRRGHPRHGACAAALHGAPAVVHAARGAAGLRPRGRDAGGGAVARLRARDLAPVAARRGVRLPDGAPSRPWLLRHALPGGRAAADDDLPPDQPAGEGAAELAFRRRAGRLPARLHAGAGRRVQPLPAARPFRGVAMNNRAALHAAAAAVCVFLMLPTLIVIPMSVSTERYLTFPPEGF